MVLDREENETPRVGLKDRFFHTNLSGFVALLLGQLLSELNTGLLRVSDGHLRKEVCSLVNRGSHLELLVRECQERRRV
jgi:hypothetical protein